MMYHAIASKLTEDGKLRLDEILGDEEAKAERRARSEAALASSGFTVLPA